ncbi:MAG: PatB family C-S lyase [Marinobacter sp.]|nr:PatB family C-S lyase [Marinobacter sp.]
MASVDFDQALDRSGTHTVKFDGRKGYFNDERVLPMWVADMDFAAPTVVTEALIARAQHPVYGYTLFPDSLYGAMQAWFSRRHGWQIARDWILMAPGVVPSLHAAVMAFSEPGDAIVVQPPVYFPFFSAVRKTGRRVVENPLRQEGGRYVMDLEHLEHCAREGARMLILCSPHNPVGRVWEMQELQGLLAIAERYDMLVLSDEIHCDLVYPGARHQVTAGLPHTPGRIITTVAPSKTFNIPGLGLSALVVEDASQRQALQQVFGSLNMVQSNPFSVTGFEAAYVGGEAWLDSLLMYLAQSRDRILDTVARDLPGVRAIRPEGTYLCWLDFSALGLADAALQQLLVKQAGVGLSAGYTFGSQGSGFMRLNFATPRARVLEALSMISQVLPR